MPAKPLTLDHLRRYAVARTLFGPLSLKAALHKLGFVQADPIRAPARAQDLILRHRVKDYRAGDLERHFRSLGVEEDFFVVYGFVTRELQALMHPRTDIFGWSRRERERARLLLEFVIEQGESHPRDVDAFFAHGKVRNYWGGQSKATTHLLSQMHYSGMLRIVGRDNGIRLYAAHTHGPAPMSAEERAARLDALIDAAVALYAPVHSGGLSYLVARMRYAAPQWRPGLKAALRRAKERLTSAVLDGVDWYWPARENPRNFATDDAVRLLAPFDPIVWDRDRLELLWNWLYRFEAYTPAAKRKLGYYAMPMLWRDRIIGWANLEVKDSSLTPSFGYIAGSAPNDALFRRELEAEVQRIGRFLSL